MKKFGLIFCLLSVISMQMLAQKITVSGTVKEKGTEEAVVAATVVLLKPDSAMVCGVASGLNGKFSLPAVKSGSYILKVSFVGMKTMTRNLLLSKDKPQQNVGLLELESDALLLKATEVTAKVAKVEMKADTFVYNSAAYRLPEGSVLEELVKKLPGAEVGDDGSIKINGKDVKKIMVDGKEFFNNDTKMAMKNLPTTMVEKIKAYERQSDYTRQTGIDDGEEETVLDLSVKKDMKQGWVVNTDVGYGTEERYTAKGMVARFTDRFQATVMGSANNINDRSFPGGGPRGGGGGGNGLVSSKMAGANFAWENGKKEREAGRLEAGGHVRYSHTDTDSETRTNSQTFLVGSTASSFANSRSLTLSNATNVGANFRVEWAIDSMTTVMFRPNFSYSDSYRRSGNFSVTFNRDPYQLLSDPLTEWEKLEDDGLVNTNDRSSVSDGRNRSVDGSLSLNRRLNKPGRNINLWMSAGWSDSENTSFSRSDVKYFQAEENKKGDYTHQYNLSPSENYNYRARLSYSEPLFKGANLQFSYGYQYRFSDSDRSMYSLESLLEQGIIDENTLYGWPLTYVPGVDWLDLAKNWRNSQYATYREYNQDANVMFRYNKNDLRLNAGISVQPQTTHMDYQKGTIDTTVTRHVFNWAPRIDLRYKISGTSQVRLRYNGRASQPSMTNLLDVTDDSDPLNVTMGNPGLKPSWTNSMNLFYNNYITDRQMGWMVHANASMTNNSISTAVWYDENTGKRVSQPQNINGNWNTNANLMFNSAMGAKKYFNISTFTNWSYANSVGYISSRQGQALADALSKSTTKKTDVSERLNVNYRNDVLEVGLNGNVGYQHARNALVKNANLDTWNFSYGGNLIVNFPWNMSLSTDIGEDSRRGYDDATMNTNELIWNAQLSQSFLKRKAATVSIQWYDILRERSNISRSITAMQRSDTWSNAINSYVMVHFIYRLNLMGNKEARGQMRGPGFDGPATRGPGGGHPGGGFGPPMRR
ncbi:MAG: outer membrane beta-barrel protein [Paraprevotella sp.]|nr:outer membrane beta-barrel protein [Paraprevotella sp.]